MHKRIHDLALQAGGSHYPDVGGKTLEKFAKLIVKECAEIARSNTRVDSKLYLMIQEHFGVEE